MRFVALSKIKAELSLSNKTTRFFSDSDRGTALAGVKHSYSIAAVTSTEGKPINIATAVQFCRSDTSTVDVRDRDS